MQRTVEVNDAHWDDFRMLLAVAERGSLALAAQSLGVSTSTVSRRLAAWEARLGMEVVSRRRDGVRLLPAGQKLLAAARRLQAEVQQAESSLAQFAKSERGKVVLSAGDGMAEALLPVFDTLRRAHPHIDLELRVETAVADLGKWEADLAIRAVRPAGEGLLARRLGSFRLGLYAAPGYLQRHGLPETRADLLRHPTVGLSQSLSRNPGARLLVRAGVERPAFTFNSVALGVDAVRAGLGIGPVVHGLAGGLQRVLPELQSAAHPYWLVRHRDSRGVSRVDCIANGLYAQLRTTA